jgi:hypothetical protein
LAPALHVALQWCNRQRRAIWQWWNRLPVSGKLVLAGAVFGILSGLLPVFSVSVSGRSEPSESSSGGMYSLLQEVALQRSRAPDVRASWSVLVGEDWHGAVGLLGFIATIVLFFILYGEGIANRALCWSSVGICGLLVVLALLLLVKALSRSHSVEYPGLQVHANVGLGAFVYLIASGVALLGAILKVREEKLV